MSLEQQAETTRLERAEVELSRSLKFYLEELRKEGASIEDAKVLVFKMCNEIFID